MQASMPCQIFVNVVSVEVGFIVLQGIRQKNTVFGYVASDYIVRTHVNCRFSVGQHTKSDSRVCCSADFLL